MLTARRGQLVVTPDTGEATAIPLADIAVVLFGQGWTISGAALSQLSEYGATAMVVDWRGVPLCSSFSWASTTRVGARQLAQAQCTLPRRKSAWAALIREKVRNQARVLQLLDRDGDVALLRLIPEIRSGDSGNIEAQAARLYWSFLFGDLGFSRNPGLGISDDKSGQLNSCLDYGYAVLRSFGIRAVLSAGLNPTLGLFHRGRGNVHNLVDDLIEPFRPLVDLCVASFDDDASLDLPSYRHRLVAAATSRYSEIGRGADTELELLAQRLGGYFEGDAEKLTVPHWEAAPQTWEVGNVSFEASSS